MSKKAVAALAGTAVLAASTAALGAATVPWRAHTSTLSVLTSSGTVGVEGLPGRTGVLRLRYVLPRTWERRSTAAAATTRFITKSSCGHRVVLTGRLAVGPDQPAAARLDALLPTTTGAVRASGTREDAAFRVLRVKGSATVSGVLVQPLSARFAGVAAGQRVFAEVRATATADPKRECHAGGPRSVGDALGDAFAAGSAGGFVMAG